MPGMNVLFGSINPPSEIFIVSDNAKVHPTRKKKLKSKQNSGKPHRHSCPQGGSYNDDLRGGRNTIKSQLKCTVGNCWKSKNHCFDSHGIDSHGFDSIVLGKEEVDTRWKNYSEAFFPMTPRRRGSLEHDSVNQCVAQHRTCDFNT